MCFIIVCTDAITDFINKIIFCNTHFKFVLRKAERNLTIEKNSRSKQNVNLLGIFYYGVLKK